jgi:hypothetical protein
MLHLTVTLAILGGSDCAAVANATALVAARPSVQFRTVATIGGAAPEEVAVYERVLPDRKHLIDRRSGIELVSIGAKTYMRRAGAANWTVIPKMVGSIPDPTAEFTSPRSCARVSDGVIDLTLERIAGVRESRRLYLDTDGYPTKVEFQETLAGGIVRRATQAFAYDGVRIDEPTVGAAP